MTKPLKEFDQSARTWVSVAGFPRDVGNNLVLAIPKVAQQTQHMTPAELEQYGADEFVKLERAHGTRWRNGYRPPGVWSTIST